MATANEELEATHTQLDETGRQLDEAYVDVMFFFFFFCLGKTLLNVHMFIFSSLSATIERDRSV